MSTITSTTRYITTAALAVAAAIATVTVAPTLAPAVIAFVLAALCVDAIAAVERSTARHEQKLRTANAWALAATHSRPSAPTELDALDLLDAFNDLDETGLVVNIASRRSYAHAAA